MNINATVPFCQFSTQRPVVFQWLIKYAKACRMQFEYLVLSQIISEVQYLDSNSSTWCNGGYCCLSIQEFADTWGMSPATVRSAIKCLELAGIISVQRNNGGSNTITLTPHTEWVVSNFRELRTPNKKQRVSPTPATPSHWVEDTDTTNTPPDTDTPATVVVNTDTPPDTDTPATPSADIVTPSPWLEDTRYPYRVLTDTPATPSADTTPTPNTPATPSPWVEDTDTPPDTDTPATVTGGNGKPILKQRVSPTPATPSADTPPATNGEPCPAHISAIFNNFKNGKKQRQRVSPTPATPSADTDTDTPVTDTPI